MFGLLFRLRRMPLNITDLKYNIQSYHPIMCYTFLKNRMFHLVWMSIEILLNVVKKKYFGKVFLQSCISNTNKNALYVFVSNVKQQK